MASKPQNMTWRTGQGIALCLPPGPTQASDLKGLVGPRTLYCYKFIGNTLRTRTWAPPKPHLRVGRDRAVLQ